LFRLLGIALLITLVLLVLGLPGSQQPLSGPIDHADRGGLASCLINLIVGFWPADPLYSMLVPSPLIFAIWYLPRLCRRSNSVLHYSQVEKRTRTDRRAAHLFRQLFLARH